MKGERRLGETAREHDRQPDFNPACEGVRSASARPGKLTVIIPTKNEEHNIRECIETVTWADEVIVCDSFSTDRTCEIAAGCPANVVQHEYVHSAAQKNWIIPQASCEWVLILDADERITRELRAAVESAINSEQYSGYRVCRRTKFLGKPIHHCGWNRDYPLRLFRRDKGRYENRAVHADVIVDGEVGRIKEPLTHHTDRNLRNYFEKLDRYSSLAAADLFNRGVRFRWWKLLLKPPTRFLKMYVWKLGFLDGFHGFLLCGLSAVAIFARYAKLWEMWQNGSAGELPGGRP